MDYFIMGYWDMSADRAAAIRIGALIKMNTLQASSSVGELEKAKMSVADLTGLLAVAEEAVGKDLDFGEGLREQAEDGNTHRGSL